MRTNTLHKFLFSHIAIELIVLLTIIPFMIFALQSAREKQINESYSLVCSDINAISAEFRAAESMIGSMHRNPSIVDVINMKEELSGVQRYYAAQARIMWYAATVNWQLLHNNYVYFAPNEVVFSPDRIFFSWEDFYGDWLRYENVDYASWRARLERDMRAAQRGFYQTEQVFTYMTRDQSRRTDTITYQVPFVDPFNSGIVVFLIDVQELLDALRFDSLLKDSFLCLYDANSLLLFSRGEPYAVTAQETGISEMRIDGTSYHIFTVKDAMSGLTYVIGTPSAFFTRSFIASFGVLFGYTVMALLVASAASVFLARRQYSPLKEVYAFFRQHSDVAFAADHAGDEYQYFLNSYMELLRSNQSIRDTIADYDAALTTRAMEDLLLGRYKNDQEMQKMCARVVLPGMWRVCTAVLEPSNCAVEKTALGVICVTLAETLKKAWKEKVLIHPLSEKRLLFIVPTEADGSAVSIAERLNTVVHTLRNNAGVEVYFAVSGCYHQPKDLAHAYEEAGSILACRHTGRGTSSFPKTWKGRMSFRCSPSRLRASCANTSWPGTAPAPVNLSARTCKTAICVRATMVSCFSAFAAS